MNVLRSRRFAALPALTLVLAMALGGCVTVFPKTQPVQLYRFAAAAPAAAAPVGGPPVDVQLNAFDFDTAAAGAQILTANGEGVAYIDGSRWAEPASEMFRTSMDQVLDASGRVRLVTAGQLKAPLRLRVSVLRFEADYSGGGKDAAPTVLVRLHAVLERQADLSIAGQQDFEAQVPASENRVTAIVAAFDQAASKALGDLTTWIAQTGAASPPAT